MTARRPQRIAIALPRDNDFYRALAVQMCRGFEACGVEATSVLRLLAADDMQDFCASVRPDVLLEMNRSRTMAEFVPDDVVHLTWVVDLGGRAVDDFAGSAYTYLFSDAWLPHFTLDAPHRWLGPGACPQDYPQRPHSSNHRLAFLGHIPNPWTPEELARDVTGGAGVCDFGSLLPAIERLLRPDDPHQALLGVEDFLRRIDGACYAIGGHPLVIDDALAYDITCRVVRHLNRTELADAALAMAARRGLQGDALARWLGIWGTPNWSRWPRFAPHYHGWLATPAQMSEVYAGCEIVLHEGTGVHFRSMDAMSTGALVSFREGDLGSHVDAIHLGFEPHVHFVPFHLHEIDDALAPYLADPVRAQAMRDAAAARIRDAHTWRHRAQGILDDLASL